jgi:glycosyltransferase involved in cell wall biosynthesis
MTRRVTIIAPSQETLGGQGIQAQALGEALVADGHAVTHIPINPPFPRGLGWMRRLPWGRTILNQALYLPGLLVQGRSDVTFVFSAAYWSFLLAPVPAILAARASGSRVVLVYHSGEADDHLSNWGRLVHPWLRLADSIVVPSEYLQRIFERHGYPTRVIRNVVDTSRFRFVERSVLRPRLLSTRNLEPHYRVDDTIRAFAILRSSYPEATLMVAGCGSEEGRLRRLASSLGEKGIRFLGRVEPGDMPALCEGSDIFVNASEVDNQPVSLLEAFAAGLPVVTTPTGGIATMVRQDETGVIVPHRSPERMAKAIDALIRGPGRARRMAARARTEVEAYTWPRVRTEWQKVICGGDA